MFIGDAITSWVAVILVVSNIPETKPDYKNQKHVREEEKSETGSVIDVLLRRPQIMLFLVFNIFISMTYTQTSFSLPVMLANVFGSNGPKYFGFLMSFNAVTVVTMTFLITPNVKNWKPLSSIALGALLYAVGFGMITFLRSYPLYFISTFIWTIGEILISTNFGTYIANNTPQNFRARFSAVTSASWVIGAVAGTSLMGRYMDYFGVQAVWVLAFFLAMIGTCGMYMLRIKSERNTINSIEMN
jgi:predicted MFS family arabinose efflux permease